jgi:hypothetical protein
MATIQFSNGVKVNFNGTPTQQDVEEVARKLNLTSQTPEKKSLLNKVGDFIGVSGLAKGITSAILTKTDKQYKDILAKSDRGETLTAGERAYFESIKGDIPTNKEVIGSALQTGATIATAGIGAGKLLPTAVKLGTAGAVAGAGKGLEQNKGTVDIIKQSFTTGLASAGTYMALVGAGKLAKIVLDRLPIKLYQSATKLDKESAQTLLDEKSWGRLGKIKGITDAESQRLNDVIQQKITENNGKINSKDYITKVFNTLKEKWTGVSTSKITKAIKNSDIEPFLKQAEVDFLTADEVRRGLGATASWAEKTKFSEDVRETLWKELVNTIRPVTGTTAEFKKLATLIETSKSLGKTMVRQARNRNISLTDFITGTGIGGIQGVGTVIAKKALESPASMTFTAVQLNNLSKVLSKIPTDKAGMISKEVLINTLKGI